MNFRSPETKRCFTEAAREAALVARRLKAESGLGKPEYETFVVRMPDASRLYGWEIRKFGALLSLKSEVGFDTIVEAQDQGSAALAKMLAVASLEQVARSN